jgi:hypothetical protein
MEALVADTAAAHRPVLRAPSVRFREHTFPTVTPETVSNLGGGMGWAEMAGRGNGMKWRVMLELIGGDGTVSTYEIGSGGSNTAECSAATVGLMLADGKRILALQHNLVWGPGGGILPPTAGVLSLSVATPA